MRADGFANVRFTHIVRLSGVQLVYHETPPPAPLPRKDLHVGQQNPQNSKAQDLGGLPQTFRSLIDLAAPIELASLSCFVGSTSPYPEP